MKLNSCIKGITELTEAEKYSMLQLMDQFYDNISSDVFYSDLSKKDKVILLFDETDVLRGFTTLVFLTLEVDGEEVEGVFSGDTIIHKEYWGSLELFKVFAWYCFSFDNLYWFLISKGYKTYKILPAFFQEFYPADRIQTPQKAQRIMHAYAKLLYRSEYDEASGVIRYQSAKDKLKSGVSDIARKELKDRHVAFFQKVNPDHIKGNDLVCIAKLSWDNLRPRAKRLLFGSD